MITNDVRLFAPFVYIKANPPERYTISLEEYPFHQLYNGMLIPGRSEPRGLRSISCTSLSFHHCVEGMQAHP
jgi:hypothetical protein